MKRIFIVTGILSIVSILFTRIAEAHEAYVLDQHFFWGELAKPVNLDSFAALKDPHNLIVTIIITIGILTALTLNYFFSKSKTGYKVSDIFESFSEYGPLFVRVSIAISFFFSAWSMSFLGPELHLAQMPFAYLLQTALFIVSACIMIGLFTELAALVAFIIFCIGFAIFGLYLVNYFNYLGEIIVLLLFGMRKWSIDGALFGPQKRFLSFQKYDTAIVRICYGTALLFAAITVKFLHPELTLEVVTHWNLTQFHWLFPHDPLLVTLGAGLAETAIGLFILIGFEMRLTILISLFYITLSLMFFREAVWPHLMLYGISFNLLVQPEIFSVDNLLFGKGKKEEKA